MDDQFKHTGVISKKELCQLYNISRETLRKLLNEKYFENLQAVDYEKKSTLLSPKQFRVFRDLYGDP